MSNNLNSYINTEINGYAPVLARKADIKRIAQIYADKSRTNPMGNAKRAVKHLITTLSHKRPEEFNGVFFSAKRAANKAHGGTRRKAKRARKSGTRRQRR